MSSAWFAVKVKSRHEKMAARSLSSQHYETLLPLYQHSFRSNRGLRHSEKPLFPGYVFAKFEADKRLPILKTPGVVEVVGFHGAPSAIDPVEIENLTRIVAARRRVFPSAIPAVGSRVRIESGPLSGVEGVLVGVRAQERLVVSVQLLQRAVSVEIDADWSRQISDR